MSSQHDPDDGGEVARPHLVRPIGPKEPMPQCSPLAIFHGCWFPVQGLPGDTDKKAEQKRRMAEAAKRGRDTVRANRDARFAEHRETIIGMMKDGKSAATISTVIGLSEPSIYGYIRAHKLKEMIKMGNREKFERWLNEDGGEFGPGDHGYSHCESHEGQRRQG